MLKRNLLTSLLLHEEVRTTKKRAAVIAPEVDKIINYAKTRTPHVAIRYINAIVTDKNASKKIMEVYTKRFAKKDSGLTRTKAAGYRGGDGAPLVDLSLVEGEKVAAPAPKPEAKPAEKKPEAKKTEKKTEAKKSTPKKK